MSLRISSFLGHILIHNSWLKCLVFDRKETHIYDLDKKTARFSRSWGRVLGYTVIIIQPHVIFPESGKYSFHYCNHFYKFSVWNNKIELILVPLLLPFSVRQCILEFNP